MRYSRFLFIVILSSSLWPFTSQAATHTTNIEQSLPEYSLHYDPKRDPFKDGHDAIKRARETNRRVLIELGGDWCKWCHVMDRFLDDNPDIKASLHQTFVMLKVNVSDENNNAKFLKAFPKPLGYPHMYVTEHNGDILWSKDTADFLQQGKYSRQQFIEFFKRWEITDAK